MDDDLVSSTRAHNYMITFDPDDALQLKMLCTIRNKIYIVRDVAMDARFI